MTGATDKQTRTNPVSIRLEQLTYRPELVQDHGDGIGTTHYACYVALLVSGAQTRCCACTGHDCREDAQRFGFGVNGETV